MSEDVVLKRNDSYWDRSRMPALARIEFRVVDSDLRAFQLLKTGGLDMMCLSPEQFREVEADDNFRKYHLVLRYYTPCLGQVWIGWNNRRAPFNDPRVRQALAHLVPRDRMVRDVYLGLAREVDVPFWSEGPQYEPQPAATALDPAQAARLLDEAGWRLEPGSTERRRDDRPFKAVLLAPRHEERMETLADEVAGAAAAAGLQIEVDRLAWPETLKRLEAGDFDAVLMGWTTSVESDPYLLWHSSQAGQGGRNLVGFSDPEADRLSEAIRGTTDPARRRDLCHDLGRLLADRQPVTMLLEPETLVAVSARFAGVRRYRLGLLPQEWYIPRQFP
jgi:peptide/nickel transport system substrate-binding protein